MTLQGWGQQRGHPAKGELLNQCKDSTEFRLVLNGGDARLP